MASPAPGEIGYVFDPYSIDFAIDPYPTYRWMREEAPVYHQPEMDFWMLTRYEDVCKAHQDAALFSSSAGPKIERMDYASTLLIGKDAPDHIWAKGMMTRVFSRARMGALDGFIREKTIELLEGCFERYGPDGEFDVVKEFTVPLPLTVISELLGIPEEYRQEIHELSNAYVSREAGSETSAQGDAHTKLWKIYFALTQKRREEPKDDPISLLIALEETDDQGVVHRMSDQEIAFRFLEMGFAGHETVAKAIPNGLMALSRFPDQRAKFTADLSLAPQLVQEMLRYDPPSQLQGRLTMREVTLHGVTIPADSRVMLATAAATRDPRAFSDPDRFDIERDNDKRTISFGFGVHKCLGIHLAQAELAIAFTELTSRFPDWQVDPNRATRVALSNVRGVSSLPMRLGKRA
ncbi:cytochrome P450 [Sphingomonas flavalba]|uniref:cytochrome P450 n=1 Tax=Sphingomonas flavalba TaxID=2559804 RepID=UPI0039E11D2C